MCIRDRTQTVSGPSAPLLADMALVYPAMLGLLDLVEDFSRAYETAKKQRSLLDFSDLEHLAVRLLVDEAGGPTPLARQWGARYTEIMVDEYQDTNQAVSYTHLMPTSTAWWWKGNWAVWPALRTT